MGPGKLQRLLFSGAAWSALVCLSLFGTACERTKTPFPELQIATTTSYLELPVVELLAGKVRVVRLAEPGTCPGHFDIRPSQAEEIRACRVLLRFDFQKSLDEKLGGRPGEGPHIGEIAVRGGMCCPATYLEACRQVAGHLVGLGLLGRADAENRLRGIGARMDALGTRITNQVARVGLAGTAVIASARQRDFCEWLGLKVAATFRAADTAGIGEIEEAIKAGKLAQVKWVIANLPEGRRTADALAERLGARVVVFENFPAPSESGMTFDALITRNWEALSGALQRSL